MKKQFLAVLLLIIIFAGSNCSHAEVQTAQNRIETCGNRILKSNRITNPVTFVYDESEKEAKLASTKQLLSRKITVYSGQYKNIENEDELAAYLSRNIALVARTYDGMFSGKLRTLQIKAAPKKYEIVSDKIAVDYMVKAGYDPIALIVLIQKTEPQKKYGAISTKNSPSKRLAVIYEYIFYKYPYYLLNNKYFDNLYYQMFLSESRSNRKLLEEKIKTHSAKRLEYE